MENNRKEELLKIAQNWMYNTIESWWRETEAWDGLIEYEVITVEECDWIVNNISIKSLKAKIND